MEPRGRYGKERRFLYRVDTGVLPLSELPAECGAQRQIEQEFLAGESDGNGADVEWIRRSHNAEPRDLHVDADREGQHVYGVSELAERLQNLADCDGGSTILIKRLRRYNENPALRYFRGKLRRAPFVWQKGRFGIFAG